jgi:hypothetical protein
MEKLTKTERAFCRRAGITANDVFYDGCNSCGTVYGLYNPWYYVRLTVNGYTKRETYRLLVRALMKKCGVY